MGHIINTEKCFEEGTGMRGNPSTLSRNSEHFYSAPRSPGFPPPVLGDLDLNLAHTSATGAGSKSVGLRTSTGDTVLDITRSYRCSGV
jgi:hypothetical protein